MAGISAVTCNYNTFYDFDYSFSSNPDDKDKSNTPMDDLINLRNSEISAAQMVALGSAMTDLKSSIQPAQPGLDRYK